MEEFGKERYGVDVLKVEVPVQMEFVAGTRSFKGEQAYTRKEALEHFRLAASSTHKPFIYSLCRSLEPGLHRDARAGE